MSTRLLSCCGSGCRSCCGCCCCGGSGSAVLLLKGSLHFFLMLLSLPLELLRHLLKAKFRGPVICYLRCPTPVQFVLLFSKSFLGALPVPADFGRINV
jgi:hypothetical protein